MTRNPDHTWPVPSWAQARDLEHLHGRAFAEATWGTGYWADDNAANAAGYYRDTGPAAGDDHLVRVAALEKSVRRLFVLSAMRSAEVAELAQRYRRKTDAIRPWKPSDGLAQRI